MLRLRLTGLVVLAALASAASWKPADNTLTTPWTAQVRPDRALPDYPRPQMVRTAWTNLNGLWDYAIQPKEAGLPSAFNGTILVPFPLESALSGVKGTLTPEQSYIVIGCISEKKLMGGLGLGHLGREPV